MADGDPLPDRCRRCDFLMHARIGLLRALNRRLERVFSDRKDPHWGRRKLTRNQCRAA
jgi:hypothetical protein